MLPNNISTLFAKALKKPDPIYGQPTESHLAELREVLSQILLFILHYEENGVHNLVRIIQDPTTYTTDYIAALPPPCKPAIYDTLIDDDEKAPIYTRKEAIQKDQISNYTTFEAAEHKAGKFILSVTEYMWVRELKRANMYYTLVTVGKMLAHLQALCRGIHALNAPALKNEMQRYHLDIEVITECINDIEYAQTKAARANNPITDAKLVIIATNAMISM